MLTGKTISLCGSGNPSTLLVRNECCDPVAQCLGTTVPAEGHRTFSDCSTGQNHRLQFSQMVDKRLGQRIAAVALCSHSPHLKITPASLVLFSALPK